jgi:hypothetical protein
MTIISRVNSRVLPLLNIVTFPVITTTLIIHANHFKEFTHSREAVVFTIVYINGLKCTIFTIFYFKLCHTVEYAYDYSNLIANGSIYCRVMILFI